MGRGYFSKKERSNAFRLFDFSTFRLFHFSTFRVSGNFSTFTFRIFGSKTHSFHFVPVTSQRTPLFCSRCAAVVAACGQGDAVSAGQGVFWFAFGGTCLGLPLDVNARFTRIPQLRFARPAQHFGYASRSFIWSFKYIVVRGGRGMVIFVLHARRQRIVNGFRGFTLIVSGVVNSISIFACVDTRAVVFMKNGRPLQHVTRRQSAFRLARVQRLTQVILRCLGWQAF